MLYYRRAIQKDAKYAPAYAAIARIDLQLGELPAAREALARGRRELHRCRSLGVTSGPRGVHMGHAIGLFTRTARTGRRHRVAVEPRTSRPSGCGNSPPRARGIPETAFSVLLRLPDPRNRSKGRACTARHLRFRPGKTARRPEDLRSRGTAVERRHRPEHCEAHEHADRAGDHRVRVVLSELEGEHRIEHDERHHRRYERSAGGLAL